MSSIRGGTLVAQSTSRGLLAGLPIAARLRLASSGARAWRWATVSTALAPVLMIGAWLVAETLQPAAYSPLHSSISGLAALGATDRWIVTGALYLVGACYLVTAACLPGLRAPARIVLLIAGISSAGIADSPQPVQGTNPQHLFWTSLGAVAIAIWPAFTASRAPSQPLILRPRGATAVTVVSVALLAWLIAETQGGSSLGLAERLVTGTQVAWPFIVILALRNARIRNERSNSVFRTDRCAAGARNGQT
jgi:hypothetical membrane protein